MSVLKTGNPLVESEHNWVAYVTSDVAKVVAHK